MIRFRTLPAISIIMFVFEGIELADKEEVSVHILMLTFRVNG